MCDKEKFKNLKVLFSVEKYWYMECLQRDKLAVKHECFRRYPIAYLHTQLQNESKPAQKYNFYLMFRKSISFTFWILLDWNGIENEAIFKDSRCDADDHRISHMHEWTVIIARQETINFLSFTLAQHDLLKFIFLFFIQKNHLWMICLLFPAHVHTCGYVMMMLVSL